MVLEPESVVKQVPACDVRAHSHPFCQFFVPLDLARAALTLRVAIAVTSARTLDSTQSVDAVQTGLVTDERFATLLVPLTRCVTVQTDGTNARLNAHGTYIMLKCKIINLKSNA